MRRTKRAGTERGAPSAAESAMDARSCVALAGRRQMERVMHRVPLASARFIAAHGAARGCGNGVSVMAPRPQHQRQSQLARMPVAEARETGQVAFPQSPSA